MSKAAENIVHESEAQRQYVRVHLPAHAYINGQTYNLSDISPAGFSIKDFDAEKSRGDSFPVRLLLPFSGFSLTLQMTAEVRHYSKKNQTLGARFTDVTKQQTTLLNKILKGFLSGDVVTSGDLLEAVSRENFVKVRHHNNAANEEKNQAFWKKQLLPLLFIACLGIAAFYLIANNVYRSAFVLQTSQAYVEVEKVDVTSPLAGVYNTLLDSETAMLKEGQVIGSIQRASFGRSVNVAGNGFQLTSPCECIILSQPFENNDYVGAGSSVINLAEINTQPWVVATVSSRNAQRLSVGDKATVYLAGNDIEVTGEVESFSMNDLGGPVMASAQGFDPGVHVKIKLDQKIPVDLAGRPARIDFKI